MAASRVASVNGSGGFVFPSLMLPLPERIRACRGGIYGPVCAKLLKSSVKGNKSFVDDKKVSDHHAIIPTEQGISLSELEYGERKIYELVVSRFLAVLLPPCEYEQTEVTVLCQGERFTARGKIVRHPGWQEIRSLQKEEGAFQDEPEEDELWDKGRKEEVLEQMPEFSRGQKILFGEGSISEGKTKPPLPFTAFFLALPQAMSESSCSHFAVSSGEVRPRGASSSTCLPLEVRWIY